MRFTLTINCENEAFGDDPGVEVASILRDAADHCESNATLGHAFPLHDANGNRVGRARFHDDAEWKGMVQPAKWHGDRMD